MKIALKETSLAGAKIYIGGAASNDKDIKELRRRPICSSWRSPPSS